MRILAFCDVDWVEGSGGVEHALAEIYPRLVHCHRAEVCLVALSRRSPPGEEMRDGVRVVRARRIPLESAFRMQVDVSFAVWRTAAALLRDFRPDVIHAHTLYYHTSLVAASLARRFGLPLVLTLHIGALDALPWRYRAPALLYERTVGARLIARAARIICVSAAVRAHAERLGADAAKLAVIPNGVDAARFAPGPRPGGPVTEILCVGRLIANKGQRYLLDAVAALVREGFRVRLSFVGDGPAEASLRARAAALGIADLTRFHGRQDRVEALLGQADLFVRPSLTEGMSLALLEAMASGLPVVASDVSGVRELVLDGVDGLVVAPRSADEIAGALKRYLTDEGLRLRCAANARRRALRYDWCRVAASTAGEMARARA